MSVSAAASGAVAVRPFNLTRWFAVTSLVCVGAISLAAAQLISQLFTDRLLRRDAEVTMEFVQSIVAADEFAGHFSGGDLLQECLIFAVALGHCHQHTDPPHALTLLRIRRQRPRPRTAAKRDADSRHHRLER